MKADAAARREDIKAKIDKRADILAMAERNVERAIRSMLGDERWEAPERPDVTPAEVPEDQAMLLMSIQRRQRLGNGVRFRETMTGSLRVNGVSRATRLRLHAHIAGWRHFINDPNHPISLSGTIDIEGLATACAATGTLELFPDPGDVAMRYRLQTTQDNGEALILTGTKHQHRSPLRLWSDLTTLSVEAADTVGILRISPLGTLTLPSSIRGDAFTRTKRAKAAARFLTYFTKSGHGTATTALRAGIQHCPHLRREVIEHSLKSSTADYSPLQVPTAADTGVTVAVVVTTTAAGRRR